MSKEVHENSESKDVRESKQESESYTPDEKEKVKSAFDKIRNSWYDNQGENSKKGLDSQEQKDYNKSDVNKTKKGAKEYCDDNGTKYREGDSLLPNTQFEVRGYRYKTDEQGRVVSAEGQLRRRDPSYTRKMEDVRSIDGQEYKTTDDRGHLIGHRFDASDKLENLVPMDAKLNQGDYVKLENTLAAAVKDGADVRLKVEPVYEGGFTRPSKFRITYSIDGDKDTVVFKNEREEKHD